MRNTWTEEEEDLLRKLWDMGCTAQEIANQIPGKTRPAVIGKSARMELKRRYKKKETSQTVATKKKTEKAEPKNLYRPTKERLEISSTAYGKKCSLHELKNNQCCWPVGNPKNKDFGFCGAKKQNNQSPYCEKHMAIAYQGKRVIDI